MRGTVFNHTATGYKHLSIHQDCQDYSSSFIDDDCAILIVADGHGDPIHARSALGAKFASQAAYELLLREKDQDQEYLSKKINLLKLKIVERWKSLVDDDVACNSLNQEEKYTPYGTTLLACLITEKLVLSVQIGDGVIAVQTDGKTTFLEHEDSIDGRTHSLCEHSAEEYFTHQLFDSEMLQGVCMASDGLTALFDSEQIFKSSILNPLFQAASPDLLPKYQDLHSFIDAVANLKGNGDDVSIAVFLRNGIGQSSN